MNSAIITIHIHQALLPLQRERLEDEIRGIQGVTVARFNHRVKHWLTVAYDSKLVTAWNILNRVKQSDKNAVFF